MTEQSVHINVTASRAKRLTYTHARRATLEDIELPSPASGQVALSTQYSGISRGTESLVFNGQVPRSEWSRMRCPYMSGDFDFPVSYGYACVARVTGTGSGVSRLKPGDMVFVLHPHQDSMVVDADACTPVPDTVPGMRAVLAANMETAVNAVWDSGVEKADNMSCAIVGAGVLGLLTATALRAFTGIEPVVVDIDARKRTVAEQMGFELLSPQALGKHLPTGANKVFHTSASASGLQTSIDHSAFEGDIIELSWYGDKSVTVALGGAFHSQRLSIRSSQVGTIAPSHRNQLGYGDRMRQALQMLDDARLDALLEEPVEFLALPDHVEAIFDADRLCQVISYS